MSTKPQIPDFTAIPANLGWLGQMRTYSFELCEQLNYCPVTPDIEFVSFLRAFSRFGIFTFGPITIDVNVVEDILLRTHPKGAGGPDHQPISDEYLRFSETVWNTVNTSERPRVDELTYLRIFMQRSEEHTSELQSLAYLLASTSRLSGLGSGRVSSPPPGLPGRNLSVSAKATCKRCSNPSTRSSSMKTSSEGDRDAALHS